MFNEKLRELCIKNRWFTKGTCAEYSRLFEMNDEGAAVETLANWIWTHSDECDYDEILDVLNQNFKED